MKKYERANYRNYVRIHFFIRPLYESRPPYPNLVLSVLYTVQYSLVEKKVCSMQTF